MKSRIEVQQLKDLSETQLLHYGIDLGILSNIPMNHELSYYRLFDYYNSSYSHEYYITIEKLIDKLKYGIEYISPLYEVDDKNNMINCWQVCYYDDITENKGIYDSKELIDSLWECYKCVNLKYNKGCE